MQKSKRANFKKFDAGAYRVGIVVAQFNSDITEALLVSALKKFDEYGVAKKAVKVCRVAGSVEMPLALQALAKQNKFDCLVAIGAIIRGETPHFDYVAKIVSEGILRVMLDFNIPIGFGVLTLNSYDEARDRINVGMEAAEAAIQSAKLIKN